MMDTYILVYYAFARKGIIQVKVGPEQNWLGLKSQFGLIQFDSNSFTSHMNRV